MVLCTHCGSRFRSNGMSRTIFPLDLSTHIAWMRKSDNTTSGWLPVFSFRRSFFSSSEARVSCAAVTQTWFPTMTGEDQPRPGRSVRQVRLFASLHSAGNWAAAAWPCPPGPRHWGQSAWIEVNAASNPAATAIDVRLFM